MWYQFPEVRAKSRHESWLSKDCTNYLRVFLLSSVWLMLDEDRRVPWSCYISVLLFFMSTNMMKFSPILKQYSTVVHFYLKGTFHSEVCWWILFTLSIMNKNSATICGIITGCCNSSVITSAVCVCVCVCVQRATGGTKIRDLLN